MSKFYFAILILYSLTSNVLAQNYFRIRVEDQETNNPIQGALVYIEEIPIGDKETDPNGFVVFQNIPLDRKVKFHVRKSGYDPFSDEFVANPEIKSDNNRTVKLKKVSTTPQVFFYGEVSDSDGKELEGATVEVTVLGKPFTTLTDKSGNYQIKIDGNTLKPIPTFQIEAKYKGCERYKASKPVPKLELIEEDIVLPCEELTEISSSQGSTKYFFEGKKMITKNYEICLKTPTIPEGSKGIQFGLDFRGETEGFIYIDERLVLEFNGTYVAYHEPIEAGIHKFRVEFKNPSIITEVYGNRKSEWVRSCDTDDNVILNQIESLINSLQSKESKDILMKYLKDNPN